MLRRPLLATTAAASAALLLSATSNCAAESRGEPTQRRRGNVPLADKHRVALSAWTVMGAKWGGAPQVQTLEGLMRHVALSGYDGIEINVAQLRKLYFDEGASDRAVVRAAQAAARSAGLDGAAVATGSLLHVTDGGPTTGVAAVHFDWAQEDLEGRISAALEADKQLGAGYATFQLHLPPSKMSTGGAYRRDSAYIALCAQRIATLQRLCFKLGLNCYLETHYGRITEDPAATVAILEQCEEEIELNGDLSHYIFRGIKQGQLLDRILDRVGHTHQRLAKHYGDLSADVRDLRGDWKQKGLTYDAWKMFKRATVQGLSSRTIVGETGALHLVDGPRSLQLDAQLVPLWRMFARHADAMVAADDRGQSNNPFSSGGGEDSEMRQLKQLLAKTEELLREAEN